MAHMYLGNRGQMDRQVVEELTQLPDNFHVLVEFDVTDATGARQRNVDILVIREDPQQPCIFLLEMKNDGRALRGQINGPWEYLDEASNEWLPVETNNPDDRNYLDQAINTSNTFRSWLLSMRNVIRDEDRSWDSAYYDLHVFPRLVLPHANPGNRLQDHNFCWRFDTYQAAIRHLMSFRDRKVPFVITRAEIARLARQLGLREEASTITELPVPTAGGGDQVQQLAVYLQAMAADIRAIRQQLQAMSTMQQPSPSMGMGMGMGGSGNGRLVPASEAMNALGDVLSELREQGVAQVLPTVHSALRQRLPGFDYRGLGYTRFKQFLDEAERRGFVRMATVNGVDYLLLHDQDPEEYATAMAGNLAAEPPLAWEELELGVRTRVLHYVDRLDRGFPYLTSAKVTQHLAASGLLPYPASRLRSLVENGVAIGLFTLGTRVVPHRETGQPFHLTTIALDRDHPIVAVALSARESSGEGGHEDQGEQPERQDEPGDTQAQIPTGATEPDVIAEEPVSATAGSAEEA